MALKKKLPETAPLSLAVHSSKNACPFEKNAEVSRTKDQSWKEEIIIREKGGGGKVYRVQNLIVLVRVRDVDLGHVVEGRVSETGAHLENYTISQSIFKNFCFFGKKMHIFKLTAVSAFLPSTASPGFAFDPDAFFIRASSMFADMLSKCAFASWTLASSLKKTIFVSKTLM